MAITIDDGLAEKHQSARRVVARFMSARVGSVVYRATLGLMSLSALVVGAFVGCGQEQLPEGAAARKVQDHVIAEGGVKRAVVGQIAMRHSTATMPPYLPADLEGCVATQSRRAGARGLGGG